MILKTFTTIAIMAFTANVFGAGFQDTAHSYNQFCETGAKQIISDMDADNSADVQNIKRLKQNVNDLVAKKNLMTGFLKIRDQYLSSYQALKDQDDKKLDHFKTLLKSSLTLSAVNLLAKSDPAHRPNSILELCKKSETNLCKYMNSKFASLDIGSEIKNLDATLKNVNESFDNVKTAADAKVVSDDLERIYKTIPSPISPDKILGDMQRLSPDLTIVLSSGSSKENIEQCLNGFNDSCKGLMEDSANLGAVLTDQMSALQKSFVQNKIDGSIKDYQSSSTFNDQSKKLLKDTLAEATKLAHSSGSGKDSSVDLLKDIEGLEKTCQESKTKTNDCKNQAAGIISYIEVKNSEIDEELKTNMNELKKYTGKSSLLKSEKLRQYVANRYLRVCSKAESKDVSSPLDCKCLDKSELATNLPGDGSELKRLNIELNNVMDRLKASATLSATSGEVGTFSKNEIREYMSYCDSSAKEKYKLICEDIALENNKMKSKKEARDWARIEKDNYVVYNPKNPDGYDIVKKRSTASIVAPALVSGITNFLPFWLQSYTLSNQIDYMTQQGIYQKQLNYMYSYDSPWMQTPYFQANFFQIPGVTTNLGSGAGFNFAK